MRPAAPLPTVSVVIPAHNAADVIGEQLDALRTQDRDWLVEVIVVDSRSTDGLEAVVREHSNAFPKVRLVRSNRPGANAARNVGIAATTADAVLLCDADDVVTDAWLDALRSALGTHDLVRGNYSVTELNEPAIVAARGEVASTVPAPEGGPVEGLGGNCGFLKQVWFELGGLREHHYGSDDIEFFWRAQRAGWRATVVPAAVVRYRLRPGLRALYRQQRAWASNRAQLLKELGPEGPVQPRSVTLAVRTWGWLVTHLHHSWSSNPQRRGRWVRVAAQCIGRVRGSLKHRVVYL